MLSHHFSLLFPCLFIDVFMLISTYTLTHNTGCSDASVTPSYHPLFMFDNCKEISSLWHDSSSFNRLVAKVMNPRSMCRVLKSCGVCGEQCPQFDTNTHTEYAVEMGLKCQAEFGSYPSPGLVF